MNDSKTIVTKETNQTQGALYPESLDELNIGSRTCAYLKKHYDSIDEVIKVGRKMAFDQEIGSLNEKTLWKTDLVSALKEAGLIRPASDFRMSFNVYTLYSEIYRPYGNCFVTSVEHLSNEQYDNFKGVTDKEVEDIKATIAKLVSKKRSYAIIVCHFGLDDGVMKTQRDAARNFRHLSTNYFCQLENHVISRLRSGIKEGDVQLPVIAEGLRNDLYDTIYSTAMELEMLHEDPIFRRERELIEKLKYLEKMPLKYSDPIKRYFKYGWLDTTPVDDIGLSVRTAYCLKRIGINTVSDILRFDNRKWLVAKNLNFRALKEIVSAVQKLGYEKFEIECIANN
jgi:hypothetical protein